MRLITIITLSTASFFSGQAIAFTGMCTDAPEVQFAWDWCAPNQIDQSTVRRVCFGSVTYTDIEYRAVQLENEEGGECLFSSGEWSDHDLSDCPRGIKLTAGCATVDAVESWDEICKVLLRSRLDSKTVGTLEVLP